MPDSCLALSTNSSNLLRRSSVNACSDYSESAPSFRSHVDDCNLMLVSLKRDNTTLHTSDMKAVSSVSIEAAKQSAS